MTDRVKRFSIRWDTSMGCYRVSVPSYEGGDVVPAEEYDALMRRKIQTVGERDAARREVERLRDELRRAVNTRENANAVSVRVTMENERLRSAIEEYMLWEPRRAGHAAAHRRLSAALDEEDSNGVG